MASEPQSTVDLILSMRPEAWSALLAAVGVAWAFISQTAEWRRNRFVRGIETISALDRRFDSPEFRRTRREAAAFLLSPEATQQVENEALFDVLDFFEIVGYIWRKDVVDTETVWHFFASWLLPYVSASEAIVTHQRKSDPSDFRELVDLYEAVKYFERTQHPSREADHILCRERIDGFLTNEAALSQGPQRA